MREAILATQKAQMQRLNSKIGGLLSENEVTCSSVDFVDKTSINDFRYFTELLISFLRPALIPDHSLTFKKDFMVISLQKLQSKNGSVKEARYILESMTTNLLFLRYVTDGSKFKRLSLPLTACD